MSSLPPICSNDSLLLERVLSDADPQTKLSLLLQLLLQEKLRCLEERHLVLNSNAAASDLRGYLEQQLWVSAVYLEQHRLISHVIGRPLLGQEKCASTNLAKSCQKHNDELHALIGEQSCLVSFRCFRDYHLIKLLLMSFFSLMGGLLYSSSLRIEIY